MKKQSRCQLRISIIFSIFAASLLVTPFAMAQSPEIQQKVAELKEAMARNKQALAQYTWMEQDIISIKGEEKKEELFDVRLGPDGTAQKTPVDPGMLSDDERHRRGLRGKIVDKKIEEYKEYADSIRSLIEQYIPPKSDQLDMAYQQGNIMVGPQPGMPNQYRIIVSNYVKQGDKMLLVFDKTQMALVSMAIDTYLDDVTDTVSVSLGFSAIPGGPNHVESATINGTRKELTITIQNGSYRLIGA